MMSALVATEAKSHRHATLQTSQQLSVHETHDPDRQKARTTQGILCDMTVQYNTSQII